MVSGAICNFYLFFFYAIIFSTLGGLFNSTSSLLINLLSVTVYKNNVLLVFILMNNIELSRYFIYFL